MVRLGSRASPGTVIAQLDRAIQLPGWWILDCPVKPGNDTYGSANRKVYFCSAAEMSFTPSGLAHSAGPDSEAISQPLGSTRSVVGMPTALPATLSSWNTLALASE